MSRTPRGPGAESRTRWLLGRGCVDIRAVEPGAVTAVVRNPDGPGSHRAVYAAGAWTCTCQDPGGRCDHVRAVWRLTQTATSTTPTPSTTDTKDDDR